MLDHPPGTHTPAYNERGLFGKASHMGQPLLKVYTRGDYLYVVQTKADGQLQLVDWPHRVICNSSASSEATSSHRCRGNSAIISRVHGEI